MQPYPFFLEKNHTQLKIINTTNIMLTKKNKQFIKKKKRKNTQIVKRNWIFFTFYFVEFIPIFFIFYWGFHNFIISIFPFFKKNTTIHFYEHVF